MTNPKTIALVDASGYLYRAFHAIRSLSAPDGRPTNATFGFANMLRKLLAKRRPDAVAVAFDRPERTFRHELDSEYKAHREAMPDELVPQIDDAKALCRAMGLAVVEEPGFEADDLIATLADRSARAGLRVEVASADKDLYQLVSGEQVVVWHPVKEELLDAKGVEAVFGVPPERVIDVLALMGDAVDNIPGVDGIGEKGAKELVRTFGALEDVYARLGEVKGKRRECLEKGRDSAFRSRVLATVHRDAPVGGGTTAEELAAAYGVKELDAPARQALADLYGTFGFSRLRAETAERVRATASAAAPPDASSAPAFTDDPARLAVFLERVKADGRAGVFVATARGAPFPPRPVAAAGALSDGTAVAFPLDGPGGPAGREALAALFGSGALLVAHEAKRLFLAAHALSIDPPARFADAMLESYVEAPGLFTHDLPGDTRNLLGRLPDSLPPLPADPTPLALETAEGVAALAVRAQLPLELEAALAPRLGGSKRKVLESLELPLVPVLARMEAAGIAVDVERLGTLSKELAARLSTLEHRIHAEAKEPFNVGSPQQLGRVLFEKLGYPVLGKTAKTKSYATGSDVLEELAARGVGPLPALVLEWRELSKLKGTYVDALPSHLAADGRVHTRFDQAVAATGRLSSNDPNLQNIPVRTETGRSIRKAFVAPEGQRLVVADYSQIELRILAHLVAAEGDSSLVEVFLRGEDFHRATAARIFGADPGLVSHDQRRAAKTINFGILYGMGPFALAAQLGIPQPEAKRFIAAYFERFPGIRSCLDRILERARETGATETLFGRPRPIPGLSDRNHAVRANAERMAMNAPFQGTAADLIKKAMIDLDAALARQVPSARLLLQVHDELVLECRQADVPRVSALTKETMEGVASLAVPLVVDVGDGATWADAK